MIAILVYPNSLLSSSKEHILLFCITVAFLPGNKESVLKRPGYQSSAFNNLQPKPYSLLLYIVLALPEFTSYFCFILNSPISSMLQHSFTVKSYPRNRPWRPIGL
jgi:hypothetical protein